MKILLFSIITILMLSVVSFGQDDFPIIGKISDLTGKKKIYLVAETTASRKEIQKIIDKDKTFQIVSDAKDADFILEFKPISKNTPPNYGMGVYQDIAEMTAYYYNDEKRKIVAWSETKDKYKKKGIGLPKKNEIYLTDKFLKALKSA